LTKKERQAEETQRKKMQALGAQEQNAARAFENKRMDAMMEASHEYLMKSGRFKFNFGNFQLKANDLKEAQQKWKDLQRLRTVGVVDAFGTVWKLKTTEDIENINRLVTQNLVSEVGGRQANIGTLISRMNAARRGQGGMSQQQGRWDTAKIAEWKKMKQGESRAVWKMRLARYDAGVARMNRQRGGTPAQQIRGATMEQRKFNAEAQRNPMLTMGAGGRIGMQGAAGAGAIDMKYQKAIIKRLDTAIQQRALIYKTLKGKFVNQ
jgi:hypothetical protein